MSFDMSKLCADFLRSRYDVSSKQRLKSSHARELVAAYFGYKSHAALLAEAHYPLSQLEEASILVPNVSLIDQRRLRLRDLHSELPSSYDLASDIGSFLKEEGNVSASIWLYDSLEDYIVEVFLHEHAGIVLDELSGVMAGTNAYFDEAEYEKANVVEGNDAVLINVAGTYYGSNDPDKPFSGNEIDMSVSVELLRIAGRSGFLDFEISAGGSVKDDWRDWDGDTQMSHNC